MDFLEGLNKTFDYIENNLDDENDYKTIEMILSAFLIRETEVLMIINSKYGCLSEK